SPPIINYFSRPLADKKIIPERKKRKMNMKHKKLQYDPERKRLKKMPETIYTTVILILAAVIGYLSH
ncbi:hypothetical protein ACTQXJ_10225, partial [Collinsella sp. LCP19S3_C6]|uniref:hypothetical protein n=1 Tax=Collinsella sp. LCP19S3_C6 TaxID=3438759 RepID=UPI003F91961D